MNDIEIQGRNNIIRSFASVLLLSIYITVTYHLTLGHVETGKLIQQIIRFILTVLVMFLILKGYKWAKYLLSILFVIGIFMAIPSLSASVPFVNKIPVISLVIIYSLTVYRLIFSLNCIAYFKHMAEKL